MAITTLQAEQFLGTFRYGQSYDVRINHRPLTMWVSYIGPDELDGGTQVLLTDRILTPTEAAEDSLSHLVGQAIWFDAPMIRVGKPDEFDVIRKLTD